MSDEPGAIAAAPLRGLPPIPGSTAVEVDEDQADEGIPRRQIVHGVQPASRALRVGTPMAYGHS